MAEAKIKLPRYFHNRQGNGMSTLRALKLARDTLNWATFEDPTMRSRQQTAVDDLEEMICAVE